LITFPPECGSCFTFLGFLPDRVQLTGPKFQSYMIYPFNVRHTQMRDFASFDFSYDLHSSFIPIDGQELPRTAARRSASAVMADTRGGVVGADQTN
jgi:hypothetical protein